MADPTQNIRGLRKKAGLLNDAARDIQDRAKNPLTTDPNEIKDKIRNATANPGYTNHYAARNYVFPGDLQQHRMVFTAIEYKRENRKEVAKGINKGSVVFPIPSNLQTSYNAKWGSESLGPIGTQVADTMGLANSGKLIESIKDKVKNFSLDTIGNALNKGGASTANYILDAGSGIPIVGNIIKGALLGAGVAINPHIAMLFNGVDFREHSFSYKFVAKNQKESEELKTIIDFFSFHMLPDLRWEEQFFAYPEEWTIKFSSPVNKYLDKIGTCVLTNFQVNYNGQGIPTFFEQTGAPVEIDLAFTFSEVDIMTKERHNTMRGKRV